MRDARAFDLRAGILRIPARRVIERFTTVKGHGVVRVETELREARLVTLSHEAIEACRTFVSYPSQYNGGSRLIKFGYFAVGSFRNALRSASRTAGLAYPVSPYEFGTARAPSVDEVRALVRALRHDVVLTYLAAAMLLMKASDGAGDSAIGAHRMRLRQEFISRLEFLD